MNANGPFGPACLALDEDMEIGKICDGIRAYVAHYRKKGAVVAMSGGIDSSVVASLCVEALGADKVLGLLMPEMESSAETLETSSAMAGHLGIEAKLQDISGSLTALGCYEKRDEAIRSICPGYGPGFKSKIVLPSVVDSDSYRLFSVVICDPTGKESRYRLTTEAYLGIVAATNFKQRTRKMLEYYHADRLNYAVAGTPNKLEYDQGFFVKLGDGAADFKPIAHLYKTQVYMLAERLGVPDMIRRRPPTTDTYSMPQSQEEFFFSLPYGKMDLCLLGMEMNVPVKEVGDAVGLTEEQVLRVYRDIEQKRRSTEYLHAGPTLFGNNVHEPAARSAGDRPPTFHRSGA